MIADIITGRAPIVDPRPYRPERLEKGCLGQGRRVLRGNFTARWEKMRLVL